MEQKWNIMLRIMYTYAMMNPCAGSIQSLIEILYVLLCVVFDSRDASIHGMKSWEATVLGVNSVNASEADTFWCFSLLIGEFREAFELGGIDLDSKNILQPYTLFPVHMPRFAPTTGIATALRQCSRELRRNDEAIWLYLCKHSLDPQTENYSLRWIVCIFTADLPLPMVVQLWDVLLTERYVTLTTTSNATVDALVDMCCAMILVIRDQLLEIPQHLLSDSQSARTTDTRERILQLLQSYPLSNPRPIISLALQLREQRLSDKMDGSPLRDSNAMRPSTAPIRTVSDSQTRSARLQERLAATVHRGLSTTPKRALSWDYQNYSNISEKKEQTILQGGDTVPGNGKDSGEFSVSSDYEEIMCPSGSGSRLSDARHLLRKYTDAIQESDAIASVSKASTNLAAKALNWQTMSPKKHGYKTDSSNAAIPDLPIPNLLEDLYERDTSHPTSNIQWSPTTNTYLESTNLGSLSMSDETDTSSSLILPSLESAQDQSFSQHDNLLTPLSSMSTHTQSASMQSKPGSGLRRSRPLPSRTDDRF